MKPNWKTATLSILLVFAVLLKISPGITKSQSKTPQKESRLADQTPGQEIPTVYYNGRKTGSTKSESETDPARRAKGARYEKRLVVRDVDTGGRPVLRFSHWDAMLPPLPVARSGLVALGEVVDAKAYLSNDQSGVYSEFTVRIERVFKNDKARVVFPGELITTERWGGRVIFPSGRVIIYGDRGQGMPQPGREYLFFLERNPEQYNLLTAYQLNSGQVEPLDGRDAPGGESSEWAGNAFKGITITQFLHEVDSTIAKSLAEAREQDAENSLERSRR